ncbi:MAG TPA: ABC transporter permease, partial [Flavobacteriales bacterium]|nr:ABC transporter permease [Flavobacteriales bacterium]
MMSVKEGVYDNMISTTVGDYSGYAQIHARDYWQEKTIEYSFEPTEELINAIQSEELVNEYLPRIESFALAASDEITKGAMVVGIDAEKEALINGFADRVYEGEYLTVNSKGILVGA